MRDRGFTLLELVLALGLLSILMVALVRLLDTSFTIWSDTEQDREQVELASDMVERIAEDLRALVAGPGGDLVAAWEMRDLDGDGLAGAPLAQMGLVRMRSGAQGARRDGRFAREAQDVRAAPLPRRSEVLWCFGRRASDAVERAASRPRPGGSATSAAAGAFDAADPQALTPVLVRIERPWSPEGTIRKPSGGGTSFARARRARADSGSLLDVAGRPYGTIDAFLASEAEVEVVEQSGACLWLSIWFADQTSVLKDGWSLGGAPRDCRASWDARELGRPDAEACGFNDAASDAGPRDPLAAPRLPRRARIELEVERAADLVLRPRLARALEPGEERLQVDDGRRLLLLARSMPRTRGR